MYLTLKISNETVFLKGRLAVGSHPYFVCTQLSECNTSFGTMSRCLNFWTSSGLQCSFLKWHERLATMVMHLCTVSWNKDLSCVSNQFIAIVVKLEGLQAHSYCALSNAKWCFFPCICRYAYKHKNYLTLVLPPFLFVRCGLTWQAGTVSNVTFWPLTSYLSLCSWLWI
jgi:hypothetical protein